MQNKTKLTWRECRNAVTIRIIWLIITINTFSLSTMLIPCEEKEKRWRMRNKSKAWNIFIFYRACDSCKFMKSLDEKRKGSLISLQVVCALGPLVSVFVHVTHYSLTPLSAYAQESYSKFQLIRVFSCILLLWCYYCVHCSPSQLYCLLTLHSVSLAAVHIGSLERIYSVFSHFSSLLWGLESQL